MLAVNILIIIHVLVNHRSTSLGLWTQGVTLLFRTTVGFPSGSVGKESTCNADRPGFDSWVRKMPWGRKRQPTPVCLSGKSHGQRSLAGCSPWGHKRVEHDLATENNNRILKKAFSPSQALPNRDVHPYPENRFSEVKSMKMLFIIRPDSPTFLDTF